MPPVQGKPSGNAVVAAFLVGLGSAWNGGNVGAVARPLADEFGVSLAAVGLLSGTVFFGAIVAANLLASAIEGGSGEEAMLVIAAFVAVAGLLNLRPPTRQIQVPAS